jgi:hypothetical protein
VNPLDVELPFESGVRYYLHDPPDQPRDVLVIGFSSSMEGKTPGYSHARALMGTGSPVLFVRSTRGIFGVNRNTEVLEAVGRLLTEVVADMGVPPKNVICCGTSLGGSAALIQAAQCGFQHVLAGAPIVAGGETLLGEGAGRAGVRIAQLVAGGREDDRDFLNRVVSDPLAQAHADMRIQVLTSHTDPTHAANIPALKAACEVNARLSLDVTMTDYQGHSDVRLAYWSWAKEKIAEIGDSTSEPVVVPVASTRSPRAEVAVPSQESGRGLPSVPRRTTRLLKRGLRSDIIVGLRADTANWYLTLTGIALITITLVIGFGFLM